jgi:hypothetical protein
MLLISLAYFLAPDFVYAFTIWPFWVWTIAALWLSLIGVRKRSWKLTVGTGLVWVLLAYFFNSEVRGLVRTLRPPQQFEFVGIWLVSLNCAGGNPAGVKDALMLNPDVLLLQESPSPTELEKLIELQPGDSEDFRYDLVVGPDASILVLGTVETVQLPKGTSNFTCVRAKLRMHNLDAFTVSLRLAPPVLRFDFWNPDCWRQYAESKAARRKELEDILAFVESQSPGAFVIIGGDFNTPPDPSIQRKLRETYTDTFADSGRGYGATAVAGFPMVRIDQIWFRGPFWTWRAGARATKHSDHLMATASLVPVRARHEEE